MAARTRTAAVAQAVPAQAKPAPEPVPVSAPPAVTEQRDYFSTMKEVIEAHINQGPFISNVAAAEIVEKLRANDPDLLFGWLNAHAVQIVRVAILEIDRSKRSSARVQTARSVFAAAAEKAEQGDSSGLDQFRTGWLDTRFVVDGERRLLADLTGDDVLKVAADYHQRAESNLLEEAFMKAIAKKVGKRRVGDVLSNEKLNQLRQSITG